MSASQPYLYLPATLLWAGGANLTAGGFRCSRQPVPPEHFRHPWRYGAYLAAFRLHDCLSCLYCDARLVREEGTRMISNSGYYADIRWCVRCGWWTALDCIAVIGSFDEEDSPSVPWWANVHQGILQVFDVSDLDAPVSALVRYFADHPGTLYELPSRQLERVVAGAFAEFWPTDVVLTRQSRDGGKDVILLDAAGRRVLVEVKRRTRPDKTESVRTVRELAGVLLAEGAARGIVVTTADHFSHDARLAAAALAERGYPIDLVDVSSLLAALEVASLMQGQDPPCRQALQRDMDVSMFTDSPPEGFTALTAQRVINIVDTETMPP